MEVSFAFNFTDAPAVYLRGTFVGSIRQEKGKWCYIPRKIIELENSNV